VRPIRNYKRRTYAVDGYLSYMEMDLAFMHPFGVKTKDLNLNLYLNLDLVFIKPIFNLST